MTQYTLTVMDLTGIQSYIFGSNNLKHIVGASELVWQVTHNWIYETLVELGPTNINRAGEFHQPALTIEGDDLQSELVYTGGGNAVIIFQNKETARKFTQILTRIALQQAPGLELVVTHQDDLIWNDGKLAEKVKAAFEQLRQKKNHRSRSMPLLSLGVTADCQFTGHPATRELKDGKERHLISAEVQAKLETAPIAEQRLKKDLDWPAAYSMPKDFDHFGRTEGKFSYLAVVHADGNKMGKRIEALSKKEYPDPYRGYIEAMRTFSKEVKEKTTASLKVMFQALKDSVQDNKIGEIELPWDKQKNRPFLPFRPLVFGGDDLTFVCDGRLGLSLTAFYLQHFTTQHRFSPDETPIYVRAGVAVVKTHYPFARAYNLAEALCQSAKTYTNDRSLSVLDWHFAVTGLVLDLEAIRTREYQVEEGSLTMRPVRVVGEDPDWQSWGNFSRIVDGFRRQANNGQRNKVKALREVLRAGPEHVQAFLKNYDYKLPDEVKNVSELAKTGWSGKRCGYFDAIEAMDFYVPLGYEKEMLK
jgi:hypothetical protein